MYAPWWTPPRENVKGAKLPTNYSRSLRAPDLTIGRVLVRLRSNTRSYPNTGQDKRRRRPGLLRGNKDRDICYPFHGVARTGLWFLLGGGARSRMRHGSKGATALTW